MSRLIAGLFASLLAASLAVAQAPGTADPESILPDAARRTAPASIILTGVPAPGNCEAKAIGADGRPLAGAAKTSFMRTCETDAKGGTIAASVCEATAVNKAGKPLAGAAKRSFIRKCKAGVKRAK